MKAMVDGIETEGFMMGDGSIWTIVAVDDTTIYILPYQRVTVTNTSVLVSNCVGTPTHHKTLVGLAYSSDEVSP